MHIGLVGGIRQTQKLGAAGADRVAITSLAGHFCIGEFEGVMSTNLYGALSGFEVVLPTGQDFADVHKIHIDVICRQLA